VNTGDGMITVNQQVIVANRRPALASPKTSASVHDVPMAVFVQEAIAQHRACGTSPQAKGSERGEPACRPGSVSALSAWTAVIHLGLPLPTASCGLPASIGRAALNRSRRHPDRSREALLTLLQVGFT
jgi:hypothetical protein